MRQRVYNDFEEFGKMFEEWADDEVCQKIEVDRHNYYNWEREELLYVDEPLNLEDLKRELLEQGKEIAKIYQNK